MIRIRPHLPARHLHTRDSAHQTQVCEYQYRMPNFKNPAQQNAPCKKELNNAPGGSDQKLRHQVQLQVLAQSNYRKWTAQRQEERKSGQRRVSCNFTAFRICTHPPYRRTDARSPVLGAVGTFVPTVSSLAVNSSTRPQSVFTALIRQPLLPRSVANLSRANTRPRKAPGIPQSRIQ